MKNIKGIIVIVVSFFIVISFAKAQSNDECKYLAVITYLRTNAEINKKIKFFFPKLFKKKDKYIEFNLSSRIDFLSIRNFEEKLKLKDLGINKELIVDYQLYQKKYFFESFESEFLNKIKQPNDSKVYLTFSKIIDNHLVIELSSFDPKMYGKRKFGYAVQLLFKFNSIGLIEDFLELGVAYN